jgi:hypothetical protein
MKTGARWILGLVGLFVLVFGLFCLNYTAAHGLEHHREAAARYNLPPPEPPIFYMGVASAVVGAGVVGFALGRRAANRSA